MSTGPSGTVTLVFTDIQDSSRLWERHGRLFEPVLALHNKLMRDQIAAHGGYEVKTEGDAFMVAFGESADALRFCVGAQQALEAAGWPDGIGAVLVRMGVHSGEPIVSADPRTGRTDYFGPMVNRAARVAAAGHGGQVLISESALKRSEHVIESYAVTDLGEHRLRGLEQPERLFQVLAPGQAAREFPPLNTVSALPTNLPPQASSFIGRQNELAELCELLAPRSSRGSGRHVGTSPGTKLMRSPQGGVTRESSRLVTLVGPGGTGKTRLSVRAGYELIDRFEGGVWFVDLSGATDAAGVAHACAAALGVRLTGKDEPVGALANVLEYRKPALLILDNFEQVAGFAAQTIGVWRQRAPRISFLVTSRAVLGLQGEQQYELAPLTPPPRRVEPGNLEQLRACESVALFVERAQEADARFVLDESNLADVCEICNELDGLPLALELAASRVRMLKPAQMVKRLGRKFELLKSSRRDLSPRQQTMYGAVEWGFELLSEWERAAFLQACVFREGFLLEAAEAVIDLTAHADAPDVLDALQSLREKSLLRAIEGEHETRFLMYRPIHEFGVERWRADAPAEAQAALSLRHAAHYGAYAWDWASRVEGPQELESLDRLEAERENVVAAVDFSATNGQPKFAAQGALGLWELLLVRGPVELRGRVLETALGASPDLLWRARLLVARSRAHQEIGEQHEAVAVAEKAMQAARECGDEVALCEGCIQHASALWYVGKYGQCAEQALIARTQAEELARPALLARALGIEGILLIQTSRNAEATVALRRAEQTCRSIGYRRGIAHNLANQGIVLGRAGEREQAVKHYEEAERIYQEVGYMVGVGRMVGNRGAQYQRAGNYAPAQACYERAVQIARELGSKQSVASNISNLASIYSHNGDRATARRMLDEAMQTYRDIGHPQGEAEIQTRLAREELKEKRFDVSLDYNDRALKTFRELGDIYNGDHAAFEGMVVLYHMKRFDEMAQRGRLLLEQAIARNDNHIAGSAASYIARALLLQANPAGAREFIEKMHFYYQKAGVDLNAVAKDLVFFAAIMVVDALDVGLTEVARELAARAIELADKHAAQLTQFNSDGWAALERCRALFKAGT